MMRRLLLPVLALTLGACGFSPLYGTRGSNAPPVAEALGRVQIANIPNREGQILRNHLIDRMQPHGRPTAPEARLAISLRSSEVDLGILKDATASRRELTMWADYALEDMEGRTLMKGTATSIVSTSKLAAQYGTLASEEDARRRALREVGEQIVNRVGLYYGEKKAKSD